MTEPAEEGDDTPSSRVLITEHDLLSIDAALEKCGGHRAHAAKVLGIDHRRVSRAIRDDARLRAKWGQRVVDEVPTGIAAEIERKEPLLPFSPEEQAAAAALTNQDTALRRGWKRLGMTTDQQKFLLTLQETYAGATSDVLKLTGAGVAHTYTRLLFTFEDILKKMRDVDENPEKYHRVSYTKSGDQYEVKGPHEFWCELQDRLVAVASELRRTTGDVQKIQLVRAQIAKIAADHAKNVTRKRQGWGDDSSRPGRPPAPRPVDPDPVETL